MARIFFLVVALGLASSCGEDGTAPTAPSLTAPPPAEPAAPAVYPWETAWIEANSHPFDGSHLSLPNEGIAFLRDIVGDARIVSLGENTHGARDFFEMKARILRFLVEEMGFNTFAIEATWPESRRLDRYVRTGEGDPAKLLSGIYFWTWRTESVLEMIEWMRAHNEAGGDIGFHGFDMQHPGMALHNVREYIREVDPGRTAVVAGQLHCLTVFANDHRGRRPRPFYGDQPEAYRELCGASLDEVREQLLANREEYEAAAGVDAFEVALQSLRVAFQYHLRESHPLRIDRARWRDEAMAENTEWISRRIGPEGRMVLWAHNTHVSTWQGAMGSYLRETFGNDMVIVGFSHEGGGFTASDGSGLREFELDAALPGSFEHFLSTASFPRLVLDLRNRDPNAPGSSWLNGRRLFRLIGALYDTENPEGFWHRAPVAEWFDVIVHFERTRATTVLPPIYPDSF